MMNNIETMEWFDKFYKKYNKFVDIIVLDNKNKMIEYEIPDIWSLIRQDEEIKKIKVYRIKGFTRFDFNELCKTGTMKEIYYVYGKPCMVTTEQNYCPTIRKMGKKSFLDEESLQRLREIFKRLIINLEYYKVYKGE